MADKKVNRVGFDVKLRVVDWMRKHKDTVRDTRSSWDQIAASIDRELQLKVPANTVRSIAKAAKLFVPKVRVKGPNSSKQMRAAMRIVVDELIQLKGELGVVVSPILLSLQEALTSTANTEANTEANGSEKAAG